MRKWAYLKEPYYCNKTSIVYKIMIHETKREAFVYLYCSKDAIMCSFDEWHPDLEDALENWQDRIDENGWHIIEDPQPYCQHDCIQPIRVKGRNINKPQWGKFEIFKDGEWIDYP